MKLDTFDEYDKVPDPVVMVYYNTPTSLETLEQIKLEVKAFFEEQKIERNKLQTRLFMNQLGSAHPDYPNGHYQTKPLDKYLDQV